MKETLKVCGILNIVYSAIYFFIFQFEVFIALPIFIFLLASGIFYLNCTNKEDLSERRNILLILGIFSLPVLLVSGLIMLLSIKKISKIQSRAPDIDPETKRIDLLIKIGLVLISLSGIIFILSGWNSLNSFLVILFLSILSLIFYLLYLLFTYKIKLSSSRRLYYILFSIFITLLYLACGYYEVFGNYFSLFGDGINLFYTTLLGLITLFIYSYKIITDSKARIYSMFITFTLSILSLLLYLGFSFVQSLVIINILTIFIRIKFKSEYLFKYTDLLMKFFILFTIVCFSEGYSISLLILVLINLIVVNYFNITKNNTLYQILSPLTTIIYSGIMIGLYLNNSRFDIEEFIILYLAFLSTIYVVLMLVNFNKNITRVIYSIMFNIILFILNIISMIKNDYVLLFVILINIVMLVCYYCYIYRRKIENVETYFVPLNLSLILISVLVYLSSYIEIGINVVLLSIMAVLSIYYFMTKNKVLNIITFVIVFIFNVVNIFASLFSSNEIIVCLTLISTIIPFILLASKYKNHIIIPYIYSLLSSYLVLLNELFEYYTSFIICILIYIVLYLIVRKDKLFNKFTILFTLLPVLTFICNIDFDIDIKILFINIILFGYILYFLYVFINKDDIELKQILFVVLTSVLFIFIIFNSNFIFGLYIGIISLTLLIYSSLKDNMRIIFVYSLVLFILNILYRLRDMWSSIPLWAYLLFAGLTIIVFATIKEIKKSKK